MLELGVRHHVLELEVEMVYIPGLVINCNCLHRLNRLLWSQFGGKAPSFQFGQILFLHQHSALYHFLINNSFFAVWTHAAVDVISYLVRRYLDLLDVLGSI
jgi:hypothetical protein